MKPKSLIPVLLVLVGCGGIFIAETTWFRANHSVTYDETLYLNISNRSVKAGKLNPIFVNVGVAPLPMILTYFPPLAIDPAPDREKNWGGALFDPQYIKGPRLMNSLLIGLPIIGILIYWLLSAHGVLAGLLGGGLLAMSPSLVAHGGLATTDLSFVLFSLISLLTIGWMARQPTLRRASIAGCSIGVAIAAKYSGLFLLPVSGLLLALHHAEFSNLKSFRISVYQIAGRYAVLLLVAGLVCWGCHLFTSNSPLKKLPLAETEDSSPWVQILGRGPIADQIMTFCHEKINRPAPYDGIKFQIEHSRNGHKAYLLGEHSSTGWWYYFPLAFVFKSTPVELLLSILALGAAILAIRHPWRNFVAMVPDRQAMLLGIAVLLGLLMNSKINIGHRYVILIYPILFMFSVDLLWRMVWLSRISKVVIAALLITFQAASSLAIGPHYLGYFNSFVGGPEGGRWLLADSNIDWGQDLPALKEFQEANPEPMVLWYCGTAIPPAYGIEAVNMEIFPDSFDDFDYAVISTSFLHGPYGPELEDSDPMAELRQLEPKEIAGTSLVIFDLNQQGVREEVSKATSQFKKQVKKRPNYRKPLW